MDQSGSMIKKVGQSRNHAAEPCGNIQRKKILQSEEASRSYQGSFPVHQYLQERRICQRVPTRLLAEVGSRNGVCGRIKVPQGKKIGKAPELVKKVGLFLDEGFIRCKGRIDNAELSYPARFPFLLPKKHWFTKLIIEECHQQALHGGVQDTLCKLREHYGFHKEDSRSNQ